VRPPIQEPFATHVQRCYVYLFSQTQGRNTTDIIHISIYQSRTTTCQHMFHTRFNNSVHPYVTSGHVSRLPAIIAGCRYVRIFCTLAPYTKKITFRPLKNVLVFGPFARRHDLRRRGNTDRGHRTWRRGINLVGIWLLCWRLRGVTSAP
jgi:hypothetical protein